MLKAIVNLCVGPLVEQTSPSEQELNAAFNESMRLVNNSTVYHTTLPDGEVVAWARKYNDPNDNDTTTCATADFSCTECTNRACNYVRLCGRNGLLLFEGSSIPEHAQWKTITLLKQRAANICSAGGEYTLELVTHTTFPPSKYTGQGSNREFHHFCIKPNTTTDNRLVERMTYLWADVQHNVSARLSHFLSTGGRDTMKIIDDILNCTNPAITLKRPEYWKSSCGWVMNILTKFSTNFDEMTTELRDEVCVYAMAIGKVDEHVHRDFQTASNLVDFLTMNTPTAVASAMDTRSDPRTNQQTQLAKAKEKHNVTAKYGVGLVWDGKLFSDDLDLHGKIYTQSTNSTNPRTLLEHVYFGNKVVEINDKECAKLDFDAGREGMPRQVEPAENISFTEEIVQYEIDVLVDNYNCMTKNKDVPFTVIITQEGKANICFERNWPASRRCQTPIHITTHKFTPVDKEPIKMSEKEGRVTIANQKEWGEMFGTPTSTIATLDNLLDHRIPMWIMAKRTQFVHKKPTKDIAGVLSEFDALVAKSNPKCGKSSTSNQGGKKKVFMSERMHMQPPTTLDELVERVSDSRITNVTVNPRDFVPGYVTHITVSSSNALKCGRNTALSLCHYEDKFSPPLKPVKTGNARIDETWLTTMSSNVQVIAIAKFTNMYFFILDSAQLSTDNVAFPKTAGFYPDDLSVHGHKHRTKWTYSNHSTPQIPEPPIPLDKSIPPPPVILAIGAFLTSETVTVTVDGTTTTMRV